MSEQATQAKPKTAKLIQPYTHVYELSEPLKGAVRVQVIGLEGEDLTQTNIYVVEPFSGPLVEPLWGYVDAEAALKAAGYEIVT